MGLAEEFDYLLHWDLPISTMVEFNEVGMYHSSLSLPSYLLTPPASPAEGCTPTPLIC